MNNLEKALLILQEDTSVSNSIKLLGKILNATKPEILLILINRNFPLTKSEADVKRLNQVLWNVKLHESKDSGDVALDIINRIVKDKVIKKEVELINYLKPMFNELPSKDNNSLYKLYIKLITTFGR